MFEPKTRYSWDGYNELSKKLPIIMRRFIILQTSQNLYQYCPWMFSSSEWIVTWFLVCSEELNVEVDVVSSSSEGGRL